jgi:hypothetical protein
MPARPRTDVTGRTVVDTVTTGGPSAAASLGIPTSRLWTAEVTVAKLPPRSL